jgi:hypothetical protein
MKRARYVSMAALFLFLTGGCKERYWSLEKVAVHPAPRRVISLEVENKSPLFITPSFEHAMQQAAVALLMKKGFVVSNSVKQAYKFRLELHVDSSLIGGHYHRRLTQSDIGAFHVSPHYVKSLEFEYILYSPLKSVVLNKNYDLYFFNNEKKDTRRSIGVMKYILADVK